MYVLIWVFFSCFKFDIKNISQFSKKGFWNDGWEFERTTSDWGDSLRKIGWSLGDLTEVCMQKFISWRYIRKVFASLYEKIENKLIKSDFGGKLVVWGVKLIVEKWEFGEKSVKKSAERGHLRHWRVVFVQQEKWMRIFLNEYSIFSSWISCIDGHFLAQVELLWTHWGGHWGRICGKWENPVKIKWETITSESFNLRSLLEEQKKPFLWKCSCRSIWAAKLNKSSVKWFVTSVAQCFKFSSGAVWEDIFFAKRVRHLFSCPSLSSFSASFRALPRQITVNIHLQVPHQPFQHHHLSSFVGVFAVKIAGKALTEFSSIASEVLWIFEWSFFRQEQGQFVVNFLLDRINQKTIKKN